MDVDNLFLFFSISSVITKLVLPIIMCLAHIWIIYTFIRFKAMRTRLQMYVLTCSVLDMIHQIDRLITALIIGTHLFSYLHLSYMGSILEIVGYYFYFLIALGLAFDWFMSCYKPHIMEKVDTHSRLLPIFIITLYIISVIVEYVTDPNVHLWYTTRESSVYKIGYFMTISILLLLVNIFSKRYKFENTYYETSHSLIIANILIYSYFPLCIHIILQKLLLNHEIIIFVLFYTLLIPELIHFAHFLLVICIMWKRIKQFRVALIMICPKCCVGAHEAEDLGEETENDNNAIGNTYMHADHYSYNAEDEALVP